MAMLFGCELALILGMSRVPAPEEVIDGVLTFSKYRGDRAV